MVVACMVPKKIARHRASTAFMVFLSFNHLHSSTAILSLSTCLAPRLKQLQARRQALSKLTYSTYLKIPTLSLRSFNLYQDIIQSKAARARTDQSASDLESSGHLLVDCLPSSLRCHDHLQDSLHLLGGDLARILESFGIGFQS